MEGDDICNMKRSANEDGTALKTYRNKRVDEACDGKRKRRRKDFLDAVKTIHQVLEMENLVKNGWLEEQGTEKLVKLARAKTIPHDSRDLTLTN